MKRILSFVLMILLLLVLCLPVMAGETLPWGEESEGWYSYPWHPTLSTLLKDDALWIVRGYFTGKEAVPDENGEALECWIFTVKETLRGKPGSELAFRVPADIDPELALRFNTGCTDLRPIPDLDYILVLNTTWIEGVQFAFFDSERVIQHLPSVAFWEYHGFNSTAHALHDEIKETAEVTSLDDLEAFLQKNITQDTGWLKPVILCGTAVVAVVWLALMGWALYKRKKDAA